MAGLGTYPVTGQQDLRNHLATGTTRDSSEYRALNNAFRDQLRAVELVMHNDLRPALHPGVVDAVARLTKARRRSP